MTGASVSVSVSVHMWMSDSRKSVQSSQSSRSPYSSLLGLKYIHVK